MARLYKVYKGLQRPLVYRGFKGKYIYYGIGALVAGLLLGGLAMSLINIWLGLFVLIACIAGGLVLTAAKQKAGLHRKTRSKGVFIHQVNYRRINHAGKAGF